LNLTGAFPGFAIIYTFPYGEHETGAYAGTAIAVHATFRACAFGFKGFVEFRRFRARLQSVVTKLILLKLNNIHH
jgi:hypothetical protein